MTAALSQALRADRPLVAVHAYTDVLDPANRAVARSWAAFSHAVASFGCRPGRAHDFTLSQQDPVSALLDRVAPGDLLVLGTRGGGRLAGLIPTAVSRAVLDAMPCDLLVVRSGDPMPLAMPSRPPAVAALRS
jgi:nucleotide-binding universal stress UspA family protein